MFKQLINKHIDRIFIAFICLIFIGEFATKSCNIGYNIRACRINGVIKLLFEIFMVISILINFKNEFIFKLMAILCLIFGITFVINYTESEFVSTLLKGNIYYFNNYIYTFLFIGFILTNTIKLKTLKLVFNIFKTIMIVNSILILFGLLFDINFFETYYNSSRFGYNGFFAKNGEVTYLYMILISILYYKFLKLNNKKDIYLAIFLSIISLLTGKKVLFLFLGLLFIYYIIYNFKTIKKYLAFLLIPIALILVFSKTILQNFSKMDSFWYDTYEEYGLLGMLTSTRSILCENSINYISKNWNWYNYFIGGINYNKYKVEFEFVDIFLFFGILGVIIFVILLKKYFFDSKNILKNNLLLIILISSFLSGTLFLNITCIVILFTLYKSLNDILGIKIN